jgi:hypothetical protein
LSTVAGVDRSLKERFYRYRGIVLHQRTGAAKDDQTYWSMRAAKRRSQPKPE